MPPNGVVSNTTKLVAPTSTGATMILDSIAAGVAGENSDDIDADIWINRAQDRLTAFWQARRRPVVTACVGYTVGIMGSVQAQRVTAVQGSFAASAGRLSVVATQTIQGVVAEWACEYTAQWVDLVTPPVGRRFDAAYARFVFTIRGVLDRAATQWSLLFSHDDASMCGNYTMPSDLRPEDHVYSFGYNKTVDVTTRVWRYTTPPSRQLVELEESTVKRRVLRDAMRTSKQNFVAEWDERERAMRMTHVPRVVDPDDPDW